MLSSKVISEFSHLTKPNRVKVLILDDSVVTRNRSKKVELSAKVYDHVSHKFVRGFSMLTLGWSDGYSFVSVAFNMLSSRKRSNRCQEISEDTDHRTIGCKVRKESLLSKPEAAVLMIKMALEIGIQADYILMYTWFTTEPLIKNILETGLDVIGMVKDLKQHYTYKGKTYTLHQLKKFVEYNPCKSIFGSEFQSRSFDAAVSHTTIVFTRYILLEWLRRSENDEKTCGELFFRLCEDIQDMDLTSALHSLMTLFTEQLRQFSAVITNVIKSKVQQWISSQPSFIQAIFADFNWES